MKHKQYKQNFNVINCTNLTYKRNTNLPIIIIIISNLKFQEVFFFFFICIKGYCIIYIFKYIIYYKLALNLFHKYILTKNYQTKHVVENMNKNRFLYYKNGWMQISINFYQILKIV